jgi:hypothetical protein
MRSVLSEEGQRAGGRIGFSFRKQDEAPARRSRRRSSIVHVNAMERTTKCLAETQIGARVYGWDPLCSRVSVKPHHRKPMLYDCQRSETLSFERRRPVSAHKVWLSPACVCCQDRFHGFSQEGSKLFERLSLFRC